MPNENNSELWPQNPRQIFTTVTTWRGNSFIVYTPMALNLISTSISLHPSPSPPSPSPFLIPKHRLFKLCSSSSCFRTSAQSGGTEGRGVTQEDPPLPAALSGMYMPCINCFLCSTCVWSAYFCWNRSFNMHGGFTVWCGEYDWHRASWFCSLMSSWENWKLGW